MSQGMLDVYEQKKAAADETASAKLSTMCVDILSMPESEIPSELRGVDVVVCSMAYHHIDDLKQATTVLASLLKKGGHLLVFDLLQSLFVHGDELIGRRSFRHISQPWRAKEPIRAGFRSSSPSSSSSRAWEWTQSTQR